MSALLETVQAARELRDRAEHEFRLALVRAKERHSLAEIGRAANMTRAGVRFLVRRERGEIDGHGNLREERKT